MVQYHSSFTFKLFFVGGLHTEINRKVSVYLSKDLNHTSSPFHTALLYFYGDTERIVKQYFIVNNFLRSICWASLAHSHNWRSLTPSLLTRWTKRCDVSSLPRFRLHKAFLPCLPICRAKFGDTFWKWCTSIQTSRKILYVNWNCPHRN